MLVLNKIKKHIHDIFNILYDFLDLYSYLSEKLYFVLNLGFIN